MEKPLLEFSRLDGFRMVEKMTEWEKWEIQAKWLIFLVLLECQPPSMRFFYACRDYRIVTGNIWKHAILSNDVRQSIVLQVNIFISGRLDFSWVMRNWWLRCRNFREYLEKKGK